MLPRNTLAARYSAAEFGKKARHNKAGKFVDTRRNKKRGAHGYSAHPNRLGFAALPGSSARPPGSKHQALQAYAKNIGYHLMVG